MIFIKKQTIEKVLGIIAAIATIVQAVFIFVPTTLKVEHKIIIFLLLIIFVLIMFLAASCQDNKELKNKSMLFINQKSDIEKLFNEISKINKTLSDIEKEKEIELKMAEIEKHWEQILKDEDID